MIATEELEVFKKAYHVALDIYRLTLQLPGDEKFGLSSQMKRAAVSINSNLMEGGSRDSTNEYKRFICISRGSASELQFQVMLAKDLGFADKEKADLIIEELRQIKKMLNGILQKLGN